MEKIVVQLRHEKEVSPVAVTRTGACMRAIAFTEIRPPYVFPPYFTYCSREIELTKYIFPFLFNFSYHLFLDQLFRILSQTMTQIYFVVLTLNEIKKKIINNEVSEEKKNASSLLRILLNSTIISKVRRKF